MSALVLGMQDPCFESISKIRIFKQLNPETRVEEKLTGVEALVVKLTANNGITIDTFIDAATRQGVIEAKYSKAPLTFTVGIPAKDGRSDVYIKHTLRFCMFASANSDYRLGIPTSNAFFKVWGEVTANQNSIQLQKCLDWYFPDQFKGCRMEEFTIYQDRDLKTKVEPKRIVYSPLIDPYHQADG